MIKIIYHKNCMDGLASAFIAKTTLGKKGLEVECIAIQYGEESILFGKNDKQQLTKPLSKEDTIYFVDFSLKRHLMIELSLMVKEIIVLDHHKTAEENLRGLEEELENITIIFDMNKSGATLCYEYFFDSGLTKKEVFNYIADRDLWKWEIPQSKEINEYLRFIIKPNDLESFENMYASFHESWFSENGSLLLSQINKQVASKVKKVQDIKILDIDFKIINATENISELGNKICEEYNTPAIIYFITEDNQVVLSFRSLDTLPDISIVAAALGGGGHRNACGCTLSFNTFMKLINEPIKNEKVNPILGNGEYKVIACGGDDKQKGKFYALAVLPTSDGLPRQVGKILPKSELIQSINDDTDIAIYFTNTASVDVVISVLEKVKEYIINDNESQNKCDTCKYIFATCKGNNQVFGNDGTFNDAVLECESYLLDNEKELMQ